MTRRLLPAIVVCAFAARVGYAVLFPARETNTDAYADIAASFAATGTLALADGTVTAAREPFYPILLGAFFKLLGPHYAVTVLLNALLGAATVWLLFLSGRRLFGERVALLAAAVTAFYPQACYYAAQPLRETLLTFLSVLCVAALLRAYDEGRASADAAAGVVNALAGLTITTFVPFGLAAAPAALLWLRRRAPRPALKLSACYLAAFIAVYGLWPLRNYAVFKTWVLGSTAAAGTIFYLYQVIPAEAGGTPAETAIIAQDPVWRESLTIADPVRRQQYFWKAGVRKALEDPGRFARLLAWRFFVDQWRLAPRPRAHYEHDSRLVRLVSWLTDGWIVPLAVLGVFLSRLRPPEMLLIPLLVLVFNLVTAPILTILRFRIPMMPWLILLACLSIVTLKDRLLARAGPGRSPR